MYKILTFILTFDELYVKNHFKAVMKFQVLYVGEGGGREFFE